MPTIRHSAGAAPAVPALIACNWVVHNMQLANFRCECWLVVATKRDSPTIPLPRPRHARKSILKTIPATSPPPIAGHFTTDLWTVRSEVMWSTLWAHRQALTHSQTQKHSQTHTRQSGKCEHTADGTSPAPRRAHTVHTTHLHSVGNWRDNVCRSQGSGTTLINIYLLTLGCRYEG